MRFDEIAVFVRSAERHQPLLEEAFARAGVPAWYSRGVRRPEISGRAFLALLRCAAEDLSAARFAEYLSFGRMPAEEGVSRPTSRWERILSKASVISGLSRWESRLQAYENELNDEQVGEREALESLREFALPVIHSLASLPGKADWERWLDALGDLALHTLDQPAAVHAVLDELQPMRGAGIVSLADVLATSGIVLPSYRRDTSRYGAVFVGSLAEHPVCASGRLRAWPERASSPPVVREDPLLLDSQRAARWRPNDTDHCAPPSPPRRNKSPALVAHRSCYRPRARALFLCVRGG
jgi:hypothetical protein